MKLAEKFYAELTARGVDVILDDRDERPGVKFKDADLLGMPIRVTIGAKSLAAGNVEVKSRTVADPKTCGNLPFGGDAATQGCGPAGASPAKGHKYVVSMSFRYVRDGQTVASTTKGSVFAW